MLHWHRNIEASQDPQQLLSVARDYLASWEPEDLARVPSHGRPTQIKGMDDLAYWHQRLVDVYCSGSGSGRGFESEPVRSLLHFFAFAVQKAAELECAPPVGVNDNSIARLFSERSMPRLFTSATTGPNEI